MSHRKLIEDVLRKAGVRQITPDGHGFTALCPFHEEHTPSFSISDKGLYVCFTAACGAKGNLYMFLRHVGKVPHDRIEDMIGPTVFTGDLPTIPTFRDRFAKKPVETLPESTATIYGAFCPEYLLERGLTKQTLRAFGVGYDITLGHVMMPVRTPDRELVGFVRRTTEEWEYYRYKVEVATGRGQVMYNIHQVQGREVVIVEGAVDCMFVHQAGIKNVVALLGSTLSRNQVELLKTRFDTFTFMLDNDATGRVATENHMRRLQAYGQVFVAAALPEGKDAADNTAESIRASYENKVYGLQWITKARDPLVGSYRRGRQKWPVEEI